jgi:hypothetical protein
MERRLPYPSPSVWVRNIPNQEPLRYLYKAMKRCQMKPEEGKCVQTAGAWEEMAVGQLVPNSNFCPSLECPIILEELDNNIH